MKYSFFEKKPKAELVFALMLMGAGTAVSDTHDSPGFDLNALKSMSLEQLVNIEVSIASKTSTKISDIAAAVYVITAEEIKRSAATSIPELLRSVPGLHVAKVNSNNWSIGARGFGGQLASSLLVLMDGRSLYTPLFGGVFWDVQDTRLDEIERIEIIRGPGGAVWGANAVNGVINIITKQADQTHETQISSRYGSYEEGTLSARTNGSFTDDTHYRLYAKSQKRGGFNFQDDTSAQDDWKDHRVGFRIDSNLKNHQQLLVQGNSYHGDAAGISYIPPISLPLPGSLLAIDNQAKFNGENLIVRWQTDEAASQSLQLTYDQTYRQEVLLTEKRTTIDIEYQQGVHWSNQQTVFGIGYRKTRDSIEDGVGTTFNVSSASDEIWNVFIQNRSINLIEKLDMIVGVKIENNNRLQAKMELQPSIRFNYHLSETSTVWSALSRAIRSPTRAEQDATLSIIMPANVYIPAIDAAFNFPLIATLTPTGMYDAEELISLEAGYRSSLAENMRIDIAAFYSQFNGLPGAQINTPPTLNIGPPQHYTMSASLINSTDFETHGVEISLWWQPFEQWQGRLNYSYVSNNNNAGFVTVPSVEQQVNLNLYGSLTDQLSANFDLRYVGQPEGLFVNAYTEIDINLTWKFTDALEINLAARNLLNSKHLEYSASVPDTRNTEIERDIYLEINWSL